MQKIPSLAAATLACLLLGSLPANAQAERQLTHPFSPIPGKFRPPFANSASSAIQLGPRPFFLVDKLEDGPLKEELLACANGPFSKSAFSIGHRGAPLQFPEHSRESYIAAARMGAGILECDVAFTKDKELVCRHAQNDLATTTNILVIPELAAKCTQPFVPAQFDAAGNRTAPASAECRTSDITLAEFKTLRGKMDSFNANARTPQEALGGNATWRTELYATQDSGTLVTHKESIELFKQLGVKMTPELKYPSEDMPFDGFTQEQYAQKLIDEYREAGVPPSDVFPQSFYKPDVLYWIANEPAYGRQAVYLDDANTMDDLPSADELKQYKAEGINIWAPPIFALLGADADGNIVPSTAAIDARAAGLETIAWSLERSGIVSSGNPGWYYQSFASAIRSEGDVMRVVDVLARDVGVMAIFSDWPATTTYYANCMGLK